LLTVLETCAEELSMLELSQLRAAARHEGGISRRLFLAYAASLSSLPWLATRCARAASRVNFASDPFALGVASGDPVPRGVVLWTRLAPRPLEPGGGLELGNVNVAWEIATDEALRNVVRRGTAIATPQLGHSVHAEVAGLQPDRWYWYRFRAGDAESPVGRTRTMPAKSSNPSELRFAFASCQHYEQGLYTAYEHMAKDEIDFVAHLGDYIYEGAGKDDLVRKHLGKEIYSLDDYRIRYAQYKSDPLLQRMHARCPWMVVWDDHELDNNCAGSISEEKDVDPVDFLIRRANAYQAYYEMMPLRHSSLPRGPRMQLYRKMSFGRLAEFLFLDTRQHRTDQPNDDIDHEINDATMSPRGTMFGTRQRGWLQQSLVQSAAGWNVLAQQTMMGMVDRKGGEEGSYDMDTWSGYGYERRRLLEFLQERRVPNPIVITGDNHANWVNELRVDDHRPETPIIATEFLGTSISSSGNGADRLHNWEVVTAENPGVRFFNGERGYVRCIVTHDAWRSDFQVVSDVTKPGAPIATRASFVVEAGMPGASPA
jgi:alkaline phosphatase D